MTTQISDLRQHMAEIADLGSAAELLGWDQNTMMPAQGFGQRAEVMATLESVTHERFVSARTGQLLEAAAAKLDSADGDSDDARIVLQTQRRYEKSRRVPSSLAAEMARSAALGHEIWAKARAENDFASFAPQLESHLELVRKYIDCFDGFDCDYDVLLDDYDPGLKTAQVQTLFDELKGELAAIVKQLDGHTVDGALKHVAYPVDGQRALAREVIGWMGFEQDGWRLDDSVHPFSSGIGLGDIRITNRYDPTYFPGALYGSMHECGHGLYSAGVPAHLARTPIGTLRSLSLHESQSRLWENLVGRSRGFCELVSPRVAELSAGALSGLDGDALFKAVNEVQPSLIRVEADEATYALHIILRFEIEQQLIAGELSVNDLPQAWNSRIFDYLGIEVPSDTRGVLQDVHWSSGSIGYFPTYALGNLIAGQLWQQVHIALPDLDAQIAAGEFGGLLGWLREHVHAYGSKYDCAELLERVVGGPMAVAPFVSYLKTKLSDAYGVTLV